MDGSSLPPELGSQPDRHHPADDVNEAGTVVRRSARASPSDDGSPRERWLLTSVLTLFATGAAIDLVLDRPARLLSAHVLFELMLFAVAVGTIGYLWWGRRRAHHSLGRVEAELASRRRERDEWRSRAERLLHGLGEEIDRQLRAWELTPAERETALLLLKGYGLKEIASLQEKSERTVRQHAIAVYRKSGLGGRAELSAFFLEDLLLPAEPCTADTGAPAGPTGCK